MAIILGRADTEHVHHHTKLYGTAPAERQETAPGGVLRGLGSSSNVPPSSCCLNKYLCLSEPWFPHLCHLSHPVPGRAQSVLDEDLSVDSVTPLPWIRRTRKQEAGWIPADVEAEGLTCPPPGSSCSRKYPGVQACQTSLPESQCLRQLSTGQQSRSLKSRPYRGPACTFPQAYIGLRSTRPQTHPSGSRQGLGEEAASWKAAQGEGRRGGRRGVEWRVRNALSALAVLPTSSLERITSCYCVDREGQELGREAGLRPSEWQRKEETEGMSQWARYRLTPGGLGRD